MSRLIHSGLLPVVLILGLISCGSGGVWAEKDDEDQKRPIVKQASLVDLAKLYQELELPMPPKGAKVARVPIWDGYDIKTFSDIKGFTFGLAVPKAKDGKNDWVFGDGFKEVPFEPPLSWGAWKIYDAPVKPEEVLQFLKMKNIQSPPNDYSPNRAELIFGLQCHFLGEKDLAEFFYWRCARSVGWRNLEQTLVLAAWNYWVEELVPVSSDRTLVASKIKKIIENGKLFKALGFDDKSDSRYQPCLDVLDRLDLNLKPVKSREGTVARLLWELADCPRPEPLDLRFVQTDRDWQRRIVWGRKEQVEFRKKKLDSGAVGEIQKKIFSKGFEAIPGLIDHVDDLRFTRTPLRMNRFLGSAPWDYFTVSDFRSLDFDVREILSAYFDFPLHRDSDGWIIKKENYLEAWKKFQNQDEYAIQRMNSFKKEWKSSLDKDFREKGEVFVSYLLARFPQKIPDIFQRLVEKNPEFPSFDPIVFAIVDGEETREHKIRLLMRGVQSKSLTLRKAALNGLIELDPGAFDKWYLDVFGVTANWKDSEAGWEPVRELGSLGLSSENPLVQKAVLDLVSNLAPDLKINFLYQGVRDGKYLNKKTLLKLFDLLVICKDEDVIGEYQIILTFFTDPGSKKYQIRNYAAYLFFKTMNIDFELEQKKPYEWEKIRKFVRDEIARQLEIEERK